MKFFFALCLLAFACLPTLAQQASQDSLLDHLTGDWVLQGTIAGKETIHDIAADWVLNHEYVQFHEVSREKDAKGAPAYEAIVLLAWDQSSAQYHCLWLDTTGVWAFSGDGIGHGKRNGNEIAFLFKGADGSIFRTNFVYEQGADTWQWLMDGEEHGKLQPFARVTLKRK